MSVKELIQLISFFVAIAITALFIYAINSDDCYLSECEDNIESINTIIKFSNGSSLNVEVASTEIQRETGLMNRNHLEKDWGMLFIFDYESDHRFWMKNTQIPLDMIFVNKNREIVYIIEDVQPCKSENCETYGTESSLYVIETNAGWVLENNIIVGDIINILK